MILRGFSFSRSSVSLFEVSQLKRFCSSVFTIDSNVVRTLVSSAKRKKLQFLLTYSKKRSGPKTEPCGTPQLTFCPSHM